MRPRCTFLLLLLFAGAFAMLKAQSEVQVSPPELSLVDGRVHIAYRLLNVTPEENFSIRITVSTESGGTINPHSLSGDIGSGIPGGGRKLIIWDIDTDRIYLDEQIYVEVFALPENKLAPVQQQAKPDMQQEFNRSYLILQSIAVPGLGLSRLNKGQPHWLRGVVAYGLLGTSVYMNRKAWNTYQEYLEPPSINQVQELFDQAYDQKKLSRTLGFAALGVWVIDLGWTILGTRNMHVKQLSGNQKGFSISTTVEPVGHTPLLSLRYSF